MGRQLRRLRVGTFSSSLQNIVDGLSIHHGQKNLDLVDLMALYLKKTEGQKAGLNLS